MCLNVSFLYIKKKKKKTAPNKIFVLFYILYQLNLRNPEKKNMFQQINFIIIQIHLTIFELVSLRRGWHKFRKNVIKYLKLLNKFIINVVV